MKIVLIGLSVTWLAASPVTAQDRSAGHPPAPSYAPEHACEIRPDAPYVNPRLPLGRAAYSQRPACRTTRGPGPGGPGLYVQGPPVRIDAPPIRVGGLRIYLVEPEIIVRPSEVTVEPPQVQPAPVSTPVATPADAPLSKDPDAAAYDGTAASTAPIESGSGL